MTDSAGSGNHDDNDFDTIDEIDAAVDAITDDHVAERLHQLLADSVLTHLSDLDPSSPDTPTPPAGPGYVDAADVDHLAALLQITEQRLTIAQAALTTVNAQRAQALYEVSCAEALLSRTLERVAKVSKTHGDAYLETVLERGQEILEEAHRTANRVVTAAKRDAEEIRDIAEKEASLAAAYAQGRPRPH